MYAKSLIALPVLNGFVDVVGADVYVALP